MLLGSFPKPLPVGKRGRAVRGFALHPPTNRQHCRGISSVCATPKPSTDKENRRGARGLPERLDYRTPQIRGQTSSPEIWSLPARLSCFLADDTSLASEESRLARGLHPLGLWHPNCFTFQATGIASSRRKAPASAPEVGMRGSMLDPEQNASTAGANRSFGFYSREGANLGGL